METDTLVETSSGKSYTRRLSRWVACLCIFGFIWLIVLSVAISKLRQAYDRDMQSLMTRVDDLEEVGSQAYRQWRSFVEMQAIHSAWYGEWVAGITPQFELRSEPYLGVRRFALSDDQRAVRQVNDYTYPDGSSKQNGPWMYNVKQASASGMYVYDNTAMFLHPLGMTVWGWPNFFSYPAEQNISFAEVFLSSQETSFALRTSITPQYDRNNSFSALSHIREDTRGWPSSYWTSPYQIIKDRPVSHSYRGTATTLRTDTCILSGPYPLTFKGFPAEYLAWQLVDGLSLSFPAKLEPGVPFNFTFLWEKNDSATMFARLDFSGTGDIAALTVAWVQPAS
eukprot:g31748.t1